MATTNRATWKLLACGALLAAMAGASSAQQLVSISGDNVNMRSQPSLSGKVLWELGRGYPLRVLERRRGWLHVVDFENDRGWVARRFTGTTPHAVVKSPRANLRSGPGLAFRVLRRAEYGEVFRVLGKREGWTRVQGADARTGWIARRLLWGARP